MGNGEVPGAPTDSLPTNSPNVASALEKIAQALQKRPPGRGERFLKWAGAFGTPVVIAVVGFVISVTINESETATSERIADAQIAGSREIAQAQIKSAETVSATDREVKVLELLVEKLTSEDKNVRTRAVKSYDLFAEFVPSLKAKKSDVLKAMAEQPEQPQEVKYSYIDLLGGNPFFRKLIRENPEDGESLYYLGESLRRTDKQKAAEIFEMYLRNESKLPPGGKTREQGYFDERTAWVSLLLAKDKSDLAAIKTGLPIRRALLEEACGALKVSIDRRPSGFTTPLSTREITQQLEGLRKEAGLDVCLPRVPPIR